MHTMDYEGVAWKKLLDYCNEIRKNELSLFSFLHEFVKFDYCLEKDLFAVGMLRDNKLMIYANENTIENDLGKFGKDLAAVKNAFISELKSNSENLTHCQLIGGWGDENEIESFVYYFAYIQNSQELDKINPLYLQCAWQIYDEWISKELSVFMTDENKEELLFKDGREKILRYLKEKTDVLFSESMQEIFYIDLSVINKIAGSYYESKACKACLCFCLSNADKTIHNGFMLEESIAFTNENIRLIRKMLQTVHDNQCLVLCNDSESWRCIGVCSEKELKEKSYIAFQFLQHMSWEMQMNGKMIVCYKCGNYLVEQKEFYISEFFSKYKKVFNLREIPYIVKRIFIDALEEKSGTILIILDNECVCNQYKTKSEKHSSEHKSEVERLLQDNMNIGIRGETLILNDTIIKSMTSIDGALLLDQNGQVYAIGVILSSSVKSKGNPSRGSRYNSAYNYIFECKSKEVKGIAVVISEDKTVDILSTMDEFKEEKSDDGA